MFLKAYKYFYFRLYTWNLNAFGEDDFPELNGLLILSFLNILNLTEIMLVFDEFLGVPVFSLLARKTGYFLAFSFGILVFNYFALSFKGEYKAIVCEYEHQPPITNKKGSLYIWIYLFVTFALLLFWVLYLFYKY